MLMFERWDQNRNIRADIPAGFNMLHLFGEVASKIYGDPQLEEGVSERWLNDTNRVYFSKVFEDRAKAYDAAKKVTKFVTGRSWVMSEFGTDAYKFTHRTFMEFFFARNLVEQHETIADLLAVLVPRVVEQQWDVISHLAVQMKTFRNQTGTSQAVSLLTELAKKEYDNVSRTTAICRFCAGALSYMVPSEIECKGAITQVMERVFSIAALGDSGSAFVLEIILGCAAERRDYVYRCLEDFLVQKMNMKVTSSDFRFCALVLSTGTEPLLFKYRNVFELPVSIRKPCLSAVQPQLLRRAAQEPFCANLYVEWYGDSFATLYSSHGMKMMVSDQRPWPKHARIGPPFVLRVVLRLSGLNAHTGLDQLTRKDAMAIVELVGQTKEVKADSTYFRARSSEEQLGLPSVLWARAIRSVEKDAYAARGLLLLYRVFDDSVNQRKSDATGLAEPDRDEPFQLPRYGELGTVIARVLKRASSTGSLEFWPANKPNELVSDG